MLHDRTLLPFEDPIAAAVCKGTYQWDGRVTTYKILIQGLGSLLMSAILITCALAGCIILNIFSVNTIIDNSNTIWSTVIWLTNLMLAFDILNGNYQA